MAGEVYEEARLVDGVWQIGADDVLPQGLRSGVGKFRDIIGVDEAETFFAEREEARDYHYARVRRKYGPNFGQLAISQRMRFKDDISDIDNDPIK